MSWDCYGEDDDNQYEFLEDQEDLNDLEIPDVPWQEDIKRFLTITFSWKRFKKLKSFWIKKKRLENSWIKAK